jgi:hypothetical protein
MKTGTVQTLGVTRFGEINEDVRTLHQLNPILFVGYFTDLGGWSRHSTEELRRMEVQDALRSFRPSISSAAGIFEVLVFDDRLPRDPDEHEDAITAKFLITAKRSWFDHRLVREAFSYTDEGVRDLYLDFQRGGFKTDLFGIGSGIPSQVDMSRTDLDAAGCQFKSMGVPLRNARLIHATPSMQDGSAA